jgi:hypothetical protein
MNIKVATLYAGAGAHAIFVRAHHSLIVAAKKQCPPPI